MKLEEIGTVFLTVVVVKKDTTLVETSGKVDIVTEMAELAKNQILYSAYTTRLTKHFSDLEWIIQNAGR